MMSSTLGTEVVIAVVMVSRWMTGRDVLLGSLCVGGGGAGRGWEVVVAWRCCWDWWLVRRESRLGISLWLMLGVVEIVVCLCWLSGMWLGGTLSPGGVVGIVVCGGGWEGQRVALELACSTDDQRRAMKQEQANLCAVSVLCASI